METERFDVLWPLGPSTVGPLELNASMGQVDGKRIGFVWDYVFRGDEMCELVKDEIRSVSVDVEFVDYTEFGNIHGPEEREVMSALPDRLRAARLDSVIIGTGA